MQTELLGDLEDNEASPFENSDISPYGIIVDSVFTTKMFFVTATIGETEARDMVALFNREPEIGKESTNRKASQAKIDDYCADMLAGEWRLSPQPIIFSEQHDDTYDQQDGQQRLKALVQAARTIPGIRIPFTFCFDAPLWAKMILDTGKRRSPADFLRMKGEANSAPLANAVRLVHCYYEVPYENADSWRKARFSTELQSKTLDKHPNVRKGLEIARASRSLLSPYIGATVWHIASQEYDVWDATEFMAGLEKGVNLTEFDARYKFREFLSRSRLNHRKWEGFELFALTVKAFNAWKCKDPSFRPYFRRTEKFPRVIPAKDLPAMLDPDILN